MDLTRQNGDSVIESSEIISNGAILGDKLIFGEAHKRYVTELVERELEESSVGDTKEEREKEGKARFCEFMKGGGCKDIFKVMEDCVEESEVVASSVRNLL